jgi:hypothetical protein
MKQPLVSENSGCWDTGEVLGIPSFCIYRGQDSTERAAFLWAKWLHKDFQCLEDRANQYRVAQMHQQIKFSSPLGIQTTRWAGNIYDSLVSWMVSGLRLLWSIIASTVAKTYRHFRADLDPGEFDGWQTRCFYILLVWSYRQEDCLWEAIK